MTRKQFDDKCKSLKLNNRESLVSWGVINNKTDEQISHDHRVPVPTIKMWLQKTYRKLGVKTRVALVVRFYE